MRVEQKNLPRGSPIGIMRLAKWWQTVVAREEFFLSHPHTNNGFCFLIISHLILKTWKRFPDIPELAKMRHGEVILTLQWRHGSTCDQRVADVQLLVFYLSHGLIQVCEIELSHMGKNNGNPNLVCENNISWVTSYTFTIAVSFCPSLFLS